MKKFIVHSLEFIVILLIFLLLPTTNSKLTTLHAVNPCPGPSGGVQIGDCFGFGEIKSLGQGTSQLVPAMFSIAAVLVIIYFLLGSFRYLKAGENKEEVQAAKGMIVSGIIGFIILMFAFLVIQFLLSSLFGIQFKIIG